MVSTTRLRYIDCLRGIAILLVILGHSIQFADETLCSSNYLYRFIYSFHMPLFMFLAGLMSGAKGSISLESIKKRAIQLLIPFFCWPLAVGLTHWNTFSFQVYPQIIDKPDCGLWFLWVLFFISAIFYFCNTLSKWTRINEECLTGVLAIILPGIYLITKYNHFGFALISWHFLFFWVGFVLNKKSGSFLLQISHKFLYFIVAFVFLFITKSLLEDYGYASLESFTSPIVVKFLKYVVDVIVAIIAIAACYGTIREIYDRQLVITNKLGGGRIPRSNFIRYLCNPIPCGKYVHPFF